MMIEGKIWKTNKFWLAEIPALDYLTQGHSKKEAYEMAKDIVLTGVNQKGFEVNLIKGPDNTFQLNSNDNDALIAHILKRQRQKHGLKVREISSRMGSTSPNAFGVYEQGKSAPTLNKLEELLHAIDPKASLILRIA